MADDRPDDETVTSGSHGGGGAPGTGAVIAALLANIALSAAKFAGFVVTGSSSLLAEGVHSVADSGNQGMVLLGGRRAKKTAPGEHPLGHGRQRYFWSFVVALVLFGLGSVFALYQGIRDLDDPEPLTRPEWALGILGIAIVIQAISLRTILRRIDEVPGNATRRQFVRRAKAPHLPVALVEALGALVGLLLALAGVGATMITDDPVYDAYGTLAIGVLLAIIALVLMVEMKSLLIGQSASRKQVEAIRAAIEIEPDVIGIIHLRTEHLGPEELLVGTKVEFMHELTVAEVASTIDRVERIIRSAVPAARIIYIEPDVHQDHRPAGFVPEHEGHIDADDPDYEEITGHRPGPEGGLEP